MGDKQVCAEARRFFENIVGRVKRHRDFPDIGGAVKDEPDSAGVEVFGEGWRCDGFEGGDEFTKVHGCLLVWRVIKGLVFLAKKSEISSTLTEIEITRTHIYYQLQI